MSIIYLGLFIPDVRSFWLLADRKGIFLVRIFGKIASFVYKVVCAGLQEALKPRELRKVVLGASTVMAGFVLFIFFGVHATLSGNYSHAIAILLFLIVDVVSYLYLYWSGNYRRFFDILISGMAVFCIYMIYVAVLDKSAAYWLLIFPLMALYLRGYKVGLYYCLALNSIVWFYFFFPLLPHHMVWDDTIAKIRFISAMSIITYLSYLYEYARYNFQKELLDLSAKLDKAARTDELTGLPNRRDMQERVEYEAERSSRSGMPFCIIMADIDDFKDINDSYGHDCGDLVLKSVAVNLKHQLRRMDIVSRWGGEEFMFLLPETEIDGAVLFAERLRLHIEAHKLPYESATIGLTMSFGVAEFSRPGNIDSLLKNADEALYEAKSSGKNKVVSRRTAPVN